MDGTPRFQKDQKVRIKTPLAKIKWGNVQSCFIGNLDLSMVQKLQHPKQIFCYWVKCGPQGFVHGYFEHDLEALCSERE